MQALSQSSFLQALGYAIANSFWQVALLWLLAAIINAGFKLSSHNRYRVAITAQAGGFAWFVVTLQFYYQQCLAATANAQVLLQNHTLIYQPGMADHQYNLLSYIAKAEMLLPYLSLAYLCLLCVLVIRWLRSYQYTARLKQGGLQKADLVMRLFVQQMASRLGIKQKVKVYLSTLVNCPLTIGFLKPIILVPVATINHLSTQQLEAVLLHELAHIRRADYLINLLLNIIETILFFNPFTRLISQSINKEREHCCDDWVLQFEYNAPMYAEALLRIACLQATPAIAMKAAGKGKGELMWRVKRLLNHKQKRFNYSQQMIALAVTTCLLVTTAWLQPVKSVKQPVAVAAKPAKAVVVAPMAAQIDNPFFSPFAFFAKPIHDEVKKATREIVTTELDKVIDTSLKEAGKALTAVTPMVIQELRKAINAKELELAAIEVQKELKAVNWGELQKVSPFVDSALIANAVSIALDNNKLKISLEKAKQSIEASKQFIVKQRQQKEALINQHLIQEAIDDATTYLNNDNFITTWIEAANTTAANTKNKEKIERHRQQALLLRKLLENNIAPSPESFSLRLPDPNDFDLINTPRVPDHAEELASWTYTNPVYVNKTADDEEEDNSMHTVYTFASQPPPPPAPPILPTKPLVHVVEVTNPVQGVSIIITIREQ